MRQTLFFIKKHPKLEIEIVATGMHLMPEFGETIKEIKKDKFKIHKIETVYKSDNKESMANFIGEFILKLTKRIISLFSNKNDVILDPFMGIGTTLRACKDLGRKCIGIEISKAYCDIAVQRLGQEVLL